MSEQDRQPSADEPSRQNHELGPQSELPSAASFDSSPENPPLDPHIFSIDGTAYPEPPPVYELSPASPHSATESTTQHTAPGTNHPIPLTYPAELATAQPIPDLPPRPAGKAYPEPPTAYESDPLIDPVHAARRADQLAAEHRGGFSQISDAEAATSQPASPSSAAQPGSSALESSSAVPAAPSSPTRPATPPDAPVDPPSGAAPLTVAPIPPAAAAASLPPAPPPASGTAVLTPRRSSVPLIIGLGILIAALLIGLAYYFLHADGRSIRAGGALANTADGLHYTNPGEHIDFTAPSTWSNYPTSTAQVMVRGDGCSFGLLEQRTLLSANSLANAEAKDMQRRHPDAQPVITPRTIAGHDALSFTGTYTDSDGEPMSQTYILINRGSNMLTFIETSTSPACHDAFNSLENSLRI